MVGECCRVGVFYRIYQENFRMKFYEEIKEHDNSGVIIMLTTRRDGEGDAVPLVT